MGLAHFVFAIVMPALGACSFVAFRLGPELPKAARKGGQTIGMGYNYFKVALTALRPKSHGPAELMQTWRQTGQQADAFTREVKWNILKTKPIAEEYFPGLSSDPLKGFGIKADEPIKMPEDDVIKGSTLLDVAFSERKRIKDKQQKKKKEEETLMGL